MTLQSDKVTGGCLGTVLGFLAGWGCIFWIGFLLCLTGIGAILGVPLILAGLALPFLTGTLFSVIMIREACPYCSGPIFTTKLSLGVDCPSCKKRIIIRNKELRKPEEM